MEESVWMYFGIIIVIIALAIITSVFISYHKDATEEQAAAGLAQLARQVDVVCKSPRDTRLTAIVQAPANSTFFAETDRICASYHGQTRCEPVGCPLERSTFLDLTKTPEFKAHEYSCAVTHGENLTISCQG